MKRETVTTRTEEQIATACVISSDYLAQVAAQLDAEMFPSDHLKRIVEWSLKYYQKYHKAPAKAIESIYHRWVEQGKASEEAVDAVHDVLERLSDEYEEGEILNVPYLVDLTGEFTAFQRIERLKEELEYSLLHSDRESAEKAILDHSNVDVGKGHAIDVLNDDEAWEKAYAETTKPLITFSDKWADAFFKEALTRDALIGILAPEKRGKTWWCVEFCIRALMCRRRVALFEVGDMSESQILKRFGQRLTGLPAFERDCNSDILIPQKIRRVESSDEEEAGDWEIQTKYKKVRPARPAGPGSAKKARTRFMRRHGLAKGQPHLLSSIHSNSSINVAGIDGVLRTWECQLKFVPDVIIIDYPDILAPEPGTSSHALRDQINATWKALRRLSQDRHCLVIAPTQADAASYDVATLGANNFSEDKRKIAHVTGMFGLNQTREEKEASRMRLNWIALRESFFTANQCLHVAQCLPLGRTFCCSTM